MMSRCQPPFERSASSVNHAYPTIACYCRQGSLYNQNSTAYFGCLDYAHLQFIFVLAAVVDKIRPQFILPITFTHGYILCDYSLDNMEMTMFTMYSKIVWELCFFLQFLAVSVLANVAIYFTCKLSFYLS